MTTDHSGGRAIAFILFGMLFISINDMLIKQLSGGYPLHQMVFVRSAIGLGFTMVMVHFEGGIGILRTTQPFLHALRGLLVVFANMTYFAALAVLPLADATALFFVAPLFITLLAIPVLGEKVGLRRMMAVLVGLLGVVIMAQPSTGSLDPTLLLPVAAAAGYAGMQVLTRKLGVTAQASAMAAYIQITFLVISLLFFAVAGDGRYAVGVENESLQFLLRAWIWPESGDWGLFLILGLMSGLVGYTLSQAYRLGAPATVAPFEYVALPLAIFWGWTVFGDWPGPRVLFGTALIAGAGLYVFLRERRQSRPVPVRRPRSRMN